MLSPLIFVSMVTREKEPVTEQKDVGGQFTNRFNATKKNLTPVQTCALSQPQMMTKAISKFLEEIYKNYQENVC